MRNAADWPPLQDMVTAEREAGQPTQEMKIARRNRSKGFHNHTNERPTECEGYRNCRRRRRVDRKRGLELGFERR
ncbi:hypothetical protein HPP92_001657 [Vanilla planifolia]|uniref:Uncharacterized protein n=1 Tax=Vanilla planifolia TaxID=51239 RepID=A0A835RYL4_VANPL|nr:hypothetical protein HPP92_001657 [Vanilla planifolia]